jgi:hypothetical protein
MISYTHDDDYCILCSFSCCLLNTFHLEEDTPIFHRYLRKFYTSVAKPMNDAIQSRWISNVVFILMKPLEWCFLFWLYLVDTSPENRIHRQYLLTKGSKKLS